MQAFEQAGYTAVAGRAGGRLVVKPADLKAEDQDRGLHSPVYYSLVGTGPLHRYIELNRNTGQVGCMIPPVL